METTATQASEFLTNDTSIYSSMRENGGPDLAQDTIMVFLQYMIASAAGRNRAQ